MSLNPQLIPITKDILTRTKEVCLNISKMFCERRYINKENIHKCIKHIDKVSDNDTYYITLDKAFECDSTAKDDIAKFNGKTLAIKVIHQQVQGIAKLPIVKEFIDKNINTHKIFVFDSISERAKSSVVDNYNTEVFEEWFLMMNMLEHIDSPRYELLDEEESVKLLETYNLKKGQLMKILTTDPIVSYFRLKREQIIRVIRPSEQSGYAIAYRIVVNGNA
jgi:DNA-directed RNA polymerase subunit H (RpoH/RPB5)